MAPRDAELVEVAPGRWRAADGCTEGDLEAAQWIALLFDVAVPVKVVGPRRLEP